MAISCVVAVDTLKAIRVLAMRSVEKNDIEYFIRFVGRWYATHMNEPYSVVQSIPFEEQLQHFFEVRYEQMDDEDIEEEAKKLLETEEEQAAREAKEEADSVDDDEFVRQAIAEEKKRLKKKQKTSPAVIPKEQAERDAVVLAAAGPMLGGAGLPQAPAQPPIREIPEDIKLDFIPQEDFDEMTADDFDLLGPPKKKLP